MLLTIIYISALLLSLSAGILMSNEVQAILRSGSDFVNNPNPLQSPTPRPTPTPTPPRRLSPIRIGHASTDLTYTVIEYPARKEVTLTLDPVTIEGAKGIATILRDDDGTRIKLNLTNVPADVSVLTLYAVDDRGTVTALGPIEIDKGVGTLSATTPLTKFMLIASPEMALTGYDANTKIFFRSTVPEGFAVIPMMYAPGEKVAAVGAPTAATTTPGAVVSSPSGTTVVVPMTETKTTYTVPTLNIPNYKSGDDTKIKVDLSGALAGARANVFITPRKDGPTEVKMRFHDLKDAPAGQKFILWAVGADGTYQKLGQIVNVTKNNEAEIKAETTLPDFGLLVTMEATEGTVPVGPAVATIHIVP